MGGRDHRRQEYGSDADREPDGDHRHAPGDLPAPGIRRTNHHRHGVTERTGPRGRGHEGAMKTGLPQAGVYCLVAIVLASTSITSGQVADSLVKAKALYAEASYDEALAILKGNDGAEAFQYRALCLLALGRTPEAERALESLITVAPTFAIAEADLPPRLVTLYSQTRRRLIPAIVKRLFAEARSDFQAKNLTVARDTFERVLTLTKDPAMAGSPEAVDLQLLVSSYLDIVKNTGLPPVPAKEGIRLGTFTEAPTAPVAARPMPVSDGRGVDGAGPTSRPALLTPAPSAASPAGLTPAAITRPPQARVLVPATTIRHVFPAFTPTPGRPSRPSNGAVRITIGADGKVKAAEMEVSVDPRYDAKLLSAARSWLYKPATLGGEPIQSQKLVQINIGP